MSNKIFVGNLDFQTTQDSLLALFSDVGPVTEVFLPTDRATGRPRGFAFVEYESEAAATTAIERFDGHELDGRTLRVSSAEARRPSPGGGRSFDGGQRPGGGGGGGGDRFKGKPKGSRRNARAKKRSL